MRSVAVLAVVSVALALSRAAGAQGADPAAAAELFRQGRAALEAKDYEGACEKLLESLRLDVRVGTLISLGECEDARGKIASARLRWQQAAQLARRAGDERAGYCEQRFAAIDARVPRLTIRIAPGAAPWTFVRKDSVDVGPAAIGVPLPIEVGTHVIVALAPKHDTRSYTVVGEEGRSTELVVQPGGQLPELPPDRDDIPPGVEPPRPAVQPQKVRPLRTASYVTGALGLVGLGMGTYFGVQAIVEANQSSQHCNVDLCDHEGTQLRRDAIGAGNASTVAFAAGGALAASGVVMFVLSLGDGGAGAVTVAPSASASTAGVRVAGRW
jgi:hypothetical protein